MLLPGRILNGLIESLRKLSKDHRIKTIMLSYRRLDYWIDWQAQKHGVKMIVVDPAYTSSECPICGSRMVESGYRRLKCSACGFEADRDVVAVLNIEKKALIEMGGISGHPNCLADDKCKPEQMRGTREPLKGSFDLQGREEVSFNCYLLPNSFRDDNFLEELPHEV